VKWHKITVQTDKLGVGQRLVLGESSHGDFQTLSAIALRYCPSLPVAFQMASSPKIGANVADVTGNVHTPTMTLKNAALLALVETILMTVLLVWNFVSNVLNVLRGVEAPIVLFASFIYAFGCLTVMVFFFVFHGAQS